MMDPRATGLGEMTGNAALKAFRDLLAANPHTGTAEQIITLSLGIVDAVSHLDRTAITQARQEADLGEKVFSKLKVIGTTLLALDDKNRAQVVKQLPASYSTIHLLCSLKPDELITAVRSGVIHPRMSVRDAQTYVKQVRFPQLIAGDAQKGLDDAKDIHLFGIYCKDSLPIEGETLEALEHELNRVCASFGVLLRKVEETSIASLKKQDRAEREMFWRQVLEHELPPQWFQDAPENLKKQFNLKTQQELLNTPLRSFTGFLINAEGGRDAFWSKHGQAYIAKLHLEQEKTEDRVQRFNLKRRLEQVLEERKELCVWRNRMVKDRLYVL